MQIVHSVFLPIPPSAFLQTKITLLPVYSLCTLYGAVYTLYTFMVSGLHYDHHHTHPAFRPLVHEYCLNRCEYIHVLPPKLWMHKGYILHTWHNNIWLKSQHRSGFVNHYTLRSIIYRLHDSDMHELCSLDRSLQLAPVYAYLTCMEWNLNSSLVLIIFNY